MNRQELLEEIRRLIFIEKIPERDLYYEGFIRQEKYLYIQYAFEQNRLKNSRGANVEEWHQIVRFALNSNPEQIQYMYKRLLLLLLRHRRSYTDYFRLKSERGTTFFPDRISDINRLFILYQQYFQIFNSAIKRIHFDHPLVSYTESSINGRINWGRTVQKNVYEFPIIFETSRWNREFNLPENMLLLLPALWLNQESKRLLNLEFVEPLTTAERLVLDQLANKTQNIVQFFPFQSLLQSVKKYANLPDNDKRVMELERMTEFRINTGIVEASPYKKLLDWIRKFRELNLRMMTQTRTNFPVETIKNLDTIYEAWIFFELVNFFSEMGRLTMLDINSETKYFEINLEGHVVRLYYERDFKESEGHAWAAHSKPDFVVMEGNAILAVFDAKNFGEDSVHIGEAFHKILAYLTNLDCGYGGLLFPNIESTVEMSYPSENHIAKHHFDLKVGHYLMKPSDSSDAIAIKTQTLQYIFNEIIDRLHLDLETFKPLMERHTFHEIRQHLS